MKKFTPVFLLLLLFTVTRLINLTLLPIYADEANYLDWGWRSLHQPGFLFYSLYDAKQPLLIWLFGLSEIILPDPLIAGRLVSILAGLTCLAGIYFTTKRLFDQKSALLASYLYLLVPIFLFFDRQALMETSIASAGIWSFYFFDKFLETNSLKNALLFSLTLAIGIWIKNSALLFVIALLGVFTLYLLLNPKKTFPSLNYLFMGLSLMIVILFPLFFQPFFWNTFSLNNRYTLGFPELLKFPFSLWLKNLLAITDISFYFLTPLVFLSALWGFVKYRSSHKYFLLWTLIPIAQLIATTKTMNFRYPASFLIPFIIFAAASLPKKISSYLIIFSIPLIISSLQLVSPPSYFQTLARFSKYSYITDYLTGDLTGYLVNSIVSYINTKASNESLIVAFALNSGNFEAALIDYFHSSPTVHTTYLDSKLLGSQTENFDCLTYSDSKFIFIAREQQQGGLNRFLIPSETIRPPWGQDYATVYTLKTGCLPERTTTITLSKN